MILNDDFARITPGDIVSYRLAAIDRPINPHRIWRGQVTSIDRLSNTIMVLMLDEKYEGESERVGWRQIVTIEQQVSK